MITLKENGYTYKGDNAVKIVFGPFWKEVHSKRKEFAPFGSKFFPFGVDFLGGDWCTGKSNRQLRRPGGWVVSKPDFRSQGCRFEPRWRRNSAHDGTGRHCTESFIITLLSSRYELNNVERDLKHQIIIKQEVTKVVFLLKLIENLSNVSVHLP